MAEAIISTVVESVFQQVASLVIQEIGTAFGVKSQLEKLKNALSTIKSVISDAEKQQTSAHNDEVRNWLHKLKGAVYDVDDVLDEFAYEHLRRKVQRHDSMKKKVHVFFSSSNSLVFRFRMGHKLNQIKEELDEIAANRLKFHFREDGVDTRVPNKLRDQTYSFVNASDIIGREVDKERIIKLLIGESEQEDTSVIPVVGMGGVGKTALAQLVYNDQLVGHHFDLKMWTCVSEEYDLKKVLDKILKSATDTDFSNLELDQLQSHLRSILSGRKYLLVLDDVWNEEINEWKNLKSLLECGSKGSKILVTTRLERVASVTGTMNAYPLNVLNEEECWSVFKRSAFRDGEENKHPKLLEIGRHIVKKCGGIPLAARTLGGMLFMRYEEKFWLSVKDNEIWRLPQKRDDILPILKLSYDLMPFYLKQCFAYCCAFTKDWDLARRDLISWWMAQGYIQSMDGKEELEDIGNWYFNELLSRSFFQDTQEGFDGLIKYCKMHDLVHDLALSVAGSEWLIVDCNTNLLQSQGVRHVLVSESGLAREGFPSSLVDARKVRSFALRSGMLTISRSFIEELIMHFKGLRVLDLSNSEFEELPSSVGNLKHLRYLNLYKNCSLKTLPNSIVKLLNLQTLNLRRCKQLKELPEDFGKLINLRELPLTSQQIYLPQKVLLRGGWCASLRRLSLYKCNALTSLSQELLQNFTALRELEIVKCATVSSVQASISYLTSLEELVVVDCAELDLVLKDEDEAMEVEELCKNRLLRLRTLEITRLPKLVALPRGLMLCSASSLQYIVLNSLNLVVLPEWLKHLTSLRVLYIDNCPSLFSLPQGMDSLTALQTLSVEGSPHLIRRCKMGTGEDWPMISHVPELFGLDD